MSLNLIISHDFKRSFSLSIKANPLSREVVHGVDE